MSIQLLPHVKQDCEATEFEQVLTQLDELRKILKETIDKSVNGERQLSQMINDLSHFDTSADLFSQNLNLENIDLQDKRDELDCLTETTYLMLSKWKFSDDSSVRDRLEELAQLPDSAINRNAQEQAK